VRGEAFLDARGALVVSELFETLEADGQAGFARVC